MLSVLFCHNAQLYVSSLTAVYDCCSINYCKKGTIDLGPDADIRPAPESSFLNRDRYFRCIITRGVTVSTSAFLACHQCYLRGFESRLGLGSSDCSMWHFLKLVARGFLRVLRFPPLLHWFNGSANKIKLK